MVVYNFIFNLKLCLSKNFNSTQRIVEEIVVLKVHLPIAVLIKILVLGLRSDLILDTKKLFSNFINNSYFDSILLVEGNLSTSWGNLSLLIFCCTH